MATEMILPVFFCLHLLGWAAVLLVAHTAWAHYMHLPVMTARNGALWQPLEPAGGLGAAGHANGMGTGANDASCNGGSHA